MTPGVRIRFECPPKVHVGVVETIEDDRLSFLSDEGKRFINVLVDQCDLVDSSASDTPVTMPVPAAIYDQMAELLVAWPPDAIPISASYDLADMTLTVTVSKPVDQAGGWLNLLLTGTGRGRGRVVLGEMYPRNDSLDGIHYVPFKSQRFAVSLERCEET